MTESADDGSDGRCAIELYDWASKLPELVLGEASPGSCRAETRSRLPAFVSSGSSGTQVAFTCVPGSDAGGTCSYDR